MFSAYFNQEYDKEEVIEVTTMEVKRKQKASLQNASRDKGISDAIVSYLMNELSER